MNFISCFIKIGNLHGIYTALGCLFFHLAVLPTETHAQPAPVTAPVTFRVLAVTNPITGLFYDLEKTKIELSASPGMLSSIYTRPSNGRLSIYRIVEYPDKSRPPQRVVVAEATIEDGGPHLVLLNLLDDGGRLQISVLDDSWTAHPENMIRVLNLSKRLTAVQLGRLHKEIAPGRSEFFPKEGRTSVVKLKAASLEDGAWTLRTQLPQAIYPYCRQTFLIQDSNPSPENPVPMEINIYNIVDTTQPPKEGA